MAENPELKPAPAPEPTTEQSRVHYDEWNVTHRSGSFAEIEPEIRVRAECVLDRLAETDEGRPRSILEVGCGTGWMAERLRGFGPLTAIDLSPRAIEVARRRGVPARFIAGDFMEVDFSGESFEVVLCIETLFYVSDQPAFVEKLAQLCGPGGLLAMTFINQWVYQRSSDIGPPVPGQVRHWRSRDQVRELLGPWFEVSDVRTVAPRGDKGVLRVVNSWKLNSIAGRVVGPDRLRVLKERAGFGGGVVLFARRRAD